MIAKTQAEISAETVRDGIFKLKSRRLNSLATILVKETISKSRNDEKTKYRFSKAVKPLRQINSIAALLFSITNDAPVKRMFKSTEWKENKFDCNIQQVKKKDFEILYYGIFFSDKVQIFKITPENIDNKIQYSNWQHAGNKGEGQFHLNNRTYKIHLDNFFEKELTYEEILKQLVNLQKAGKLSINALTIILSIIKH